MTDRLMQILKEVSDLQKAATALLDEAVVLSGRKVGDIIMTSRGEGQIVCIVAEVVAPYINGARRSRLSTHSTVRLYRKNGALGSRSMIVTERLKQAWLTEKEN